MHIPDGFLDAKTATATAALSVVGLGYALRHVKKQATAQRVPMMGLAAAFVFAAQMLNFPVAGGTSGHLIGAVLAAALLGPGTAIIVMTSVLIVQSFLFADGGVTALGANVFNMGVVNPLFGYALYRGVGRLLPHTRGRLVALSFAAWVTTVLGAVFVAGELAWSGTVPWEAGFPAMVDVHMLVGFAEAAITSVIAAALWKVRPDLLEDWDGVSGAVPRASVPQRDILGTVVHTVLVIVGLVLFVSPFASTWPDAMERIVAATGFDARALPHPLLTPMFSGYRIPGISSSTTATALAGAIGVIVAFGFAVLLSRLLLRRTKGPAIRGAASSGDT